MSYILDGMSCFAVRILLVEEVTIHNVGIMSRAKTLRWGNLMIIERTHSDAIIHA